MPALLTLNAQQQYIVSWGAPLYTHSTRRIDTARYAMPRDPSQGIACVISRLGSPADTRSLKVLTIINLNLVWQISSLSHKQVTLPAVFDDLPIQPRPNEQQTSNSAPISQPTLARWGRVSDGRIDCGASLPGRCSLVHCLHLLVLLPLHSASAVKDQH